MFKLIAACGLGGILALPAFASPARAQVGLAPTGDRPAFHLEVMKPFFDTDGFADGFGFTTSIVDATVVVPFSPGPTVFARLGFAHATLAGQPSSSVLSSPRIGMLFGGDGSTHGEMHVDFPLANEIGDDDYATGVALLTDFERIERFAPSTWAVGGSFTAESGQQSGARFGGRLGANLWIPTDDGGDAEVLGLFATYVRVPAGSVSFRAEISGLVLVSEGDGDLGDRTTSHLTLAAALPAMAAAPEVYARLPLDEGLSQVLTVVLGAKARFGL